MSFTVIIRNIWLSRLGGLGDGSSEFDFVYPMCGRDFRAVTFITLKVERVAILINPRDPAVPNTKPR